MTDHSMRGFGRAFRDAFAANDAERVAAYLHDQIDWTVFGPVDLFPLFGHHRGKQAVLEMLREATPRISLNGSDTERTLVDGDHAATMLRVSVRDLRSHRILVLRLALFAQFAEGKLITLRAVFDSFDAAEQALGRHIDISRVA